MCYFRAFWSCGEVEFLDGGLVVAGEVVLVAVALLVVAHVVVEVAVDDDGADLENVLGAVGRPPRACNSEPVFDNEPAGALDHAGGDRPAVLEGLVVFHVLAVVVQVGDGPVDVGEVEVPALAGVRAGFRGDGGEGGGDGFRAAVQDAEQLPVGPLPGEHRVAGVQRRGGLADVAADVDVSRSGPAPSGRVLPRCASMAVICCLFPSTRKTRCRTRSGSRRSASSNAAAIMSSMLSVTDAETHLSRAFGPGCAFRRAGGAAMSSGSRTAGVKSATATISAIFLIPGRVAVVLPGVPAVLRAHGDALAVALHHDHVRRRLLFLRGVAGPLPVEVARPGGEVPRDPGQLGVADPHPGPVLDDLLGLPVPAAARWKAARARIPIEYGSPGITDRASAGYRFSSCPCR